MLRQVPKPSALACTLIRKLTLALAQQESHCGRAQTGDGRALDRRSSFRRSSSRGAPARTHACAAIRASGGRADGSAASMLRRSAQHSSLT